jgi:glycerophosphoryl diester phosphodiesterase
LHLASPTSLAASWSIARLSGRVLFDIKSNSSTAVDQLIRFVLHHQGPVDWFSTADMQALNRLRHRLPGSIRLLTVGSGPALARLLALAPKPGEINGVSIEQHLLTRSVVEALRGRGLLVQAYTIDQMSRINLLAGWGVTGITTNNVTAMAALSLSHPAASR